MTHMKDNLRELQGPVSPVRAFPFALQQLLAMFVTNLVPIGLVAAAAVPSLSQDEVLLLIQNAMIASGIATFIQATPLGPLGSGLPVFMGVSFTFIVPLSAVAAAHGYPAVVGSVIAGGVFEGLLGLTARVWRRFITPVVAAVVVTGIGLSLLDTAAHSFGGGSAQDFGSVPNLLIGLTTLLTCLLWQVLTRGNLRQLSILAGLLAGSVTAFFFGKMDLSGILDGGLFALPRILPYAPAFDLKAILSICVIYLVSATETMGDAAALAGGALHREIAPREISGALTADGFGSVLAGLLGITPVTSYSENVGLTILTGVVNRNVARLGALIMVLCGLLPPVGRLVSSIPTPAIGAVMLIVIGQILVSGFEMISKAGFTVRNKLIAALSLAIGIGFTASEESGIWDVFPTAARAIFAQNVVAVIFAVAMTLNLLLPQSMEDE